MMKQVYILVLVFFLVLVTVWTNIVEARTCEPSGKVTGMKPPVGYCHVEGCCVVGQTYDIYNCFPLVLAGTSAILTMKNFDLDHDQGVTSNCDNKLHSGKELVVALSTGWFHDKSRCLKDITIHGNGRVVKAKVVDECDSSMGCDKTHDFYPPCRNNVVDASVAVWKALGALDNNPSGEMDISWFDAY